MVNPVVFLLLGLILLMPGCVTGATKHQTRNNKSNIELKTRKNATEQGTTTQNISPGQTARPIQSLAEKIFVNDRKGGLALMLKNHHLQFTVQENCLLQKILGSWSILTP